MAAELQRNGGDQGGLRAYNRRLILELIRAEGPLPKADIARRTGLSAQAASVIVNALLKDRLLRREKKVRGKVGQPTTPMALNAEGAFSIGIKIGRRSLEVMLLDFCFRMVEHAQVDYEAPYRRQVMAVLIGRLEELLGRLEPARRQRLVGVGIAMPGELEKWATVMGLAPGALDDWGGFDVAGLVAEVTGLPVQLHNDASAACAAELRLGSAIAEASALYIYIGTFVGGGVVLDGRLYPGSRGNAGAIGSMPVAGLPGQSLIRRASLLFLERDLVAAGLPEAGLAEHLADPRAAGLMALWRQEAGEALAWAIAAAASVIDFEAVVIDALLPAEELASLVAAVGRDFARLERTGLSPLEIRAGTLGPAARVLGAAILPLSQSFAPDTALLVKSPAPIEANPAEAAADFLPIDKEMPLL